MKNLTSTDTASQTVLIPFKITVAYLVVGVLWILLSDKLVELLVQDPAIFTLVAIIKGWCYVAATALMLYVLIRRGAIQIERSQRELRVTEAKYQELVESANNIIMRRDKEGRITFFNRFAQEFFGYSSDEILGRHVVGTIVPELDSSGRDLRAMIRDIGTQPELYENNENENMRRNGERVWIAWTNKPVRDEEGQVVELLCIGTDNTERKRAEELLRASEERFRLAMEATSDGLWDWDVSTGEVYYSPAYFRMLGYDTSELPSHFKTWLDLVHPDDREATWSANQACIGGETPAFSAEFRMLARDGSWRWVLGRGRAVQRDANGKALRMVGTHMDLTERTRAQDEREKLEAQLLQAQKLESVGRLAGGVAHDFNNMLGVIIGHTELAMELTAPEDERYFDLVEIQKAAQRSAELTRQLLAFARRQTVSPRVLDLNEAVAGTLKMLQRIIGEDILLNWIPAQDLWKVKMDPSQLDQILANLAVNARDAITGIGKVTIATSKVTVDELHRTSIPEMVSGEYVLLSVSDTGDGMSPDVLKHIFEPFFTTKEVGKGTGLGLATVYGIVRQNAGFIHVSSEPTQGTTFRIYLPRFMGEVAQRPTTSFPLKVRGGKETVLIVEDEEAILNLGTAVLERLGYAVLSTTSPTQAIQLVRDFEGDIDLLITDVVMPDMNGSELAKCLTRIKPGLKCLYMSGYTAEVIATRGILEEGVHFIPKPFSVKELSESVRQVLEADQGTEGSA
ncbi:MAG: PAS domain S-box protein [Syntrophobacteraceae bacterium]